MADQNKFEKMLELLVNEDKEAAQELFHEIVVEKSRDIYESLLEDEADVEEATDEEVDEAADEEVDESEDDLDEATDEEVDESDEEVEEGFDLDEFEVEADDEVGGDASDNFIDDLGMGDEGEEGDEEEEGEEGDMEDRVEDLEDALEDLKAEFEKMMAGDDEGDMDDDDEEAEEAFAFEDEEVEEAADEEVEEASDEDLDEGANKDAMMKDAEKMSKAEFIKKHGKENADTYDNMNETKTAGEEMREYVEKVSATMGDNGANTKSAVAGPNDMGGDASNLAQGADEKGRTSRFNAKEDNAGNVNVPGGKASKSMTGAKGHGAEKKGAGEAADNKTPVVGK